MRKLAIKQRARLRGAGRRRLRGRGAAAPRRTGAVNRLALRRRRLKRLGRFRQAVRVRRKRGAGRRKLALSRRQRRLLRLRGGRRRRARRLSLRAAAPPAHPAHELQPAALPAEPPSASPALQNGVNLIGFARAEIGIGESLRLAARSLETASIPFGIINFDIPMANRTEDTSWAHKETKDAAYRVNVFHMNADSVRPAMAHFGGGLFQNRYNIGYWHWELPDFPDENTSAFELVQEVWVPSQFVLESVQRKASVPVVRVQHGIQVDVDPAMNRAYYGLPDNRFLFLVMYDVQSHTPRKNPIGAVQAFLQAFDLNNPHVGLVVKINNIGSHPLDSDELLQAVAGHDNIYLLDRTMNRIEVNGLLQACDSYVSLHRSEGFGLGLAESMYLGKPVIGTNWSGNVDFMNAENSCPVNYRLTTVGQDWGPYKAYQTWAEPDVAHAARFMHDLVNHPEWRNAIALNGQQTIRTHYSPQAVGRLMQLRLTDLGLL